MLARAPPPRARGSAAGVGAARRPPFAWSLLLLLATTRAALAFEILAEGAGQGMSEEEQMARIAHAVYKLRTPIAGWVLAHYARLLSKVTGEPDNFALYRYEEGKQCAVAIAGTDSLADMADNFDGRTVAACGFLDVHAGYMNEVNDLLEDCAFHDGFLPILQGDGCSGGIHVVGHSLGGGVANVFAACANNPARPYGFAVDKLWTFGAPGSSLTPLADSQRRGGCFQGARFWNQDALTMDPIPGLSRGLNFVHPRLNATRIKAGGGDYETVEYTCDEHNAHELPNPTDAAGQPMLHGVPEYVGRAGRLFTSAGFSSPTVPPNSFVTVPDPEPECPNNFTYEEALEVAYRPRDFTSWGADTVGGLVLEFLTFLACCVGFAVTLKTRCQSPPRSKWLCAADCRGYRRGEELEVPPSFRGEGCPPRAVYPLADGSFLFVELVPEDEVEAFKEQTAALGEGPLFKVPEPGSEEASAPNEVDQVGSKYTEGEERPALSAAGHCCHRRHSGPARRTTRTQMLLFLAFHGISRLAAGIAEARRHTYRDRDEVPGRKWAQDNSDWMYFWLVAMFCGPVAIMSVGGMVLTYVHHSDIWVTVAHEIGLLLAASEAMLVLLNNVRNSWKISRILGIVVFGLGLLDVAVRAACGAWRGEALLASQGFLVVGLALMLIAHISATAPLLQGLYLISVVPLFLAVFLQAGAHGRSARAVGPSSSKVADGEGGE